MHIAMEGHALRLHLLHPPLDDGLFQLEIGDAIAQKPARHGVLFVDMHIVAGARELLRRGKPRRPGANNGDALARLLAGGSGTTQPSLKERSAIAHSMLLIVTGTSSMLSVHEASQGAGQTRPVTSGKLLVL